jgi:WXXGXW repeat (2 copies)
MVNRYFRTLVGVLGLGTLLTLTMVGRPQDPRAGPAGQGDATQEGVEPLTRGPIHEAFAMPVDITPTAGPVIPKQPPEPLEEVPPDQKPEGENVEWIPGYWSWDEDRSDFIWVSGFWRTPPPGHVWVPGHWQQADSGWQWVPGFWTVPQQETVQYLPPPPEPIDIGPSVPAPDVNSVYVPGCWLYRETRYVWRPGYWLDYRPGWLWTPAHYCWSPSGYVFVDGYWDYALDRRGLLFAPVYVTAGYVGRPRWYYQPRFVVYADALLTSLFVRPRWYHYYFGDYFEPAYRRSGYVAWVDYRVGRTAFDPLYGYYRWQHRDNPTWVRNLHEVYVARARGEIPRPPRTFVQQNTVVQNVTNINVNNISVKNIQNVALVQSLSQVNRSLVKLQPVSREYRVQAQRAATQTRELSRQRAQAETRLVAAGSAPVRPRSAPQAVRLNLPQARVAAQSGTQPPPPPPGEGRRAAAETARPAPKGEVGARPTPRPPVRPEAKPPVQPERKPEVKPPVRSEGKPEPRPAPRPEAKPPAQPAPRPETKPPVGKEVKPEPRPVPRPEVKPPARPEAKPEIRPPAPRQEVKPPVAKPVEPQRPKPEDVKPPAGAAARPPATRAPEPRPAVPQAQPTPRPQPPAPAARTEPRPQPAVRHEPLPHPEVRPVAPPPAAQHVQPRPAAPPPPAQRPTPPPAPARNEKDKK